MSGLIVQIANKVKKLYAEVNSFLDVSVGSRLSHENATLLYESLLQAIQGLSPVTGSQVFSDVGAFSFVVPDRVTKINVTIIAAGGGGAGHGIGFGSAGGGAGAAIFNLPMSVNPGDTINGSVGAGGDFRFSNSSTAAAGISGGSSVFGSFTVSGGSGGRASTTGGTVQGGSGGAKPTSVPDQYALAGGNGSKMEGNANISYGGLSPIGLLHNNAGKGGNGTSQNNASLTAGNNGRVEVSWG